MTKDSFHANGPMRRRRIDGIVLPIVTIVIGTCIYYPPPESTWKSPPSSGNEWATYIGMEMS